MSTTPIGEIVQCSASRFIAQCVDVPRPVTPRLYDPPPLGSLVKAVIRGEGRRLPLPVEAPAERDPFADSFSPNNASVSWSSEVSFAYALVCGSETTTLDAGRRPAALGYGDEEEMLMQQPQISELLRTEFTAHVVGHVLAEDGRIRRYLPDCGPRIHSPVYPCTPEEALSLTADLTFLRSAFQFAGSSRDDVAIDDVVSACLRRTASLHPNPDGYLRAAARSLAILLPGEYNRLQFIIRSLQ